tara:strand:+ start:422 stop:706 length:285 start_codon:yes stop_codon:yes gene_type:complete
MMDRDFRIAMEEIRWAAKDQLRQAMVISLRKKFDSDNVFMHFSDDIPKGLLVDPVPIGDSLDIRIPKDLSPTSVEELYFACVSACQEFRLGERE